MKARFMNALSTIGQRARRVAQRARQAIRGSDNQAAPSLSAERASRVLFVGHTRFSVHQYGSRYFNATRDGDAGAGFSEEQYTQWLYSDERMDPRTEIFTTLSLPQLAQAAEDFNVVHYVSYSPSLPQKHKNALRQAARSYEFLELNETNKTVSSTPTKNLIRKAAQKHHLSSGPIGVYRLDDDDVLSVNYFHLMAPYVRSSHIGWWVSQGLGIAAVRLGDDFVYARDYYYPKSAFGPLCIAGYDNGEVSHTQAPKHTVMDHTNPTILDSREPAYFHIRHRGQDSTLGGKPLPFYPEAMMRIRSEGPADLERVRTLFPLVADRLRLTPGKADNAVTLEPTALSANSEPVHHSWDQPGALALRVELPDRGKLAPRQLRVSFSTTEEAHCEYSKAQEREFFAAANVQSDDAGYSAWVPHQSTGLGHILVLEPPQGVRITSLRLHADQQEPLTIQQATAYPL